MTSNTHVLELSLLQELLHCLFLSPVVTGCHSRQDQNETKQELTSHAKSGICFILDLQYATESHTLCSVSQVIRCKLQLRKVQTVLYYAFFQGGTSLGTPLALTKPREHITRSLNFSPSSPRKLDLIIQIFPIHKRTCGDHCILHMCAQDNSGTDSESRWQRHRHSAAYLLFALGKFTLLKAGQTSNNNNPKSRRTNQVRAQSSTQSTYSRPGASHFDAGLNQASTTRYPQT